MSHWWFWFFRPFVDIWPWSSQRGHGWCRGSPPGHPVGPLGAGSDLDSLTGVLTYKLTHYMWFCHCRASWHLRYLLNPTYASRVDNTEQDIYSEGPDLHPLHLFRTFFAFCGFITLPQRKNFLNSINLTVLTGCSNFGCCKSLCLNLLHRGINFP